MGFDRPKNGAEQAERGDQLQDCAAMSCCAPGRTDDPDDSPAASAPSCLPTPDAAGASDQGSSNRVLISGGSFQMGTSGPIAYPADGETAVHTVAVSPFLIDQTAVTNDRFARFVAETGYITDAERYGWSFVFGGLLPDDFEETRGVAHAPWWRQVFGADWSHPEGPHSDLRERGDHPVIHISHNDAMVFCEWTGCRLPTEAEWEFAARGGLDGRTFPWGDDREPDGQHRMNVWQGEFPSTNTADDGFVGTAPVTAYEPNANGLYNMCGNVWEWCSDWFGAVRASWSTVTGG